MVVGALPSFPFNDVNATSPAAFLPSFHTFIGGARSTNDAGVEAMMASLGWGMLNSSSRLVVETQCVLTPSLSPSLHSGDSPLIPDTYDFS